MDVRQPVDSVPSRRSSTTPLTLRLSSLDMADPTLSAVLIALDRAANFEHERQLSERSITKTAVPPVLTKAYEQKSNQRFLIAPFPSFQSRSAGGSRTGVSAAST
jgi:hypothetical protein